MLKRCNQVLNIGRTEGCELVHHLPRFISFQRFHWPFTILNKQFLGHKSLTCSQHNCQHGVKHLFLNQGFDLFNDISTYPLPPNVHAY